MDRRRRITPAILTEVKKRLRHKEGQERIAFDLGISQGSVSKIARGLYKLPKDKRVRADLAQAVAALSEEEGQAAMDRLADRLHLQRRGR